MDLRGKSITVHDMCLRDGMHPKQHQITVEQMVTIALSAGGRRAVGHGNIGPHRAEAHAAL